MAGTMADITKTSVINKTILVSSMEASSIVIHIQPRARMVQRIMLSPMLITIDCQVPGNPLSSNYMKIDCICKSSISSSNPHSSVEPTS